MTQHCQGCRFHHNAGHSKDSPLAKKYNDWCCKHGGTAKGAVGHCKQHNWKELK